MKGKGINKRLYERRLELDYSTLEASIRLDITKRHLYLIEHGYIKVKKDLQPKFIHKYKLPQDFFENDEYLGYPTPIVAPTKTTTKKMKHPIIFGAAVLVCMIGSIIASSFGMSMYPKINDETSSFYTQEIIKLRDLVQTYGEEKTGSSDIAKLLLDSYHQIQDENVVVDDVQYACSLNFFDLEENLPYTFIQISSYSSPTLFSEGHYDTSEIRYVKNAMRIHWYSYELDIFGLPIETSYYHVSADYNSDKNTTKINIIESYDDIFGRIILSDTDPLYLYYSLLFVNGVSDIKDICMEFFLENFPITYSHFKNDLMKGNADGLKYEAMTQRLTIFGAIGFILCFAILFVLAVKYITIAIKNKKPKEVNANVSSIDSTIDSVPIVPKKERVYAPLPKNSRFVLFVPEMVLRVFALGVLLAGSIGLYTLFRNVIDVNIGGVIKNLAYESEIGSLTSIALTLVFFIKLNIQQNSTSKFKSNCILFFAGLGYYLLLLIVEFQIGTSESLMSTISGELLNVLPGNFFWGTLSFNLLATALFSNPTFKTKQNLKTRLVRLTAIIPITYMVISALYFTGKNMWGWDFPLAVTTLLFSKSTTLIIFAILYCFFVFIYQKIVIRKYGPENAAIYYSGTRYNAVINVGVSIIIALLGVLNIILANKLTTKIPGLGSDSFILFTIPFILFYRQHLGDRNKKWDIAFMILFGAFLALGMLMIVGNLSDYLASI